jgi:hypothetical protein
MRITIDMVTAHGDGVEVSVVVLHSRKSVEKLIRALKAAAAVQWPKSTKKQ